VGGGCIYSRFYDIGTSRRSVVRFMPLPLYPWGKSPRYPLEMRLGEPQNRFGRRGEKKILAPTGTRTSTPRPSSPQSVTIPTALSHSSSRFIKENTREVTVPINTTGKVQSVPSTQVMARVLGVVFPDDSLLA
jgi:hypothetical protein